MSAPVFGALVAAAGVAMLVIAWADSRRVAREAAAKSDAYWRGRRESDAGWTDRRSVKR